MILLQPNSINQVNVSLTENQVGTGSVYLIKVVNDESKQIFSASLEDQSDDRMSYNLFYIPVSSSGIQDTGSLVLALSGFYHYTFLEPGSSNILEIGKIQLLPAVSSSGAFFTSSYAPASVFNPAQYSL